MAALQALSLDAPDWMNVTADQARKDAAQTAAPNAQEHQIATAMTAHPAWFQDAQEQNAMAFLVATMMTAALVVAQTVVPSAALV